MTVLTRAASLTRKFPADCGVGVSVVNALSADLNRDGYLGAILQA
jgi:hypothetical protein